MARPPIKRRPQTPDKEPPKANRQALLTAQKMVDAQLPTEDDADVGRPPRFGAEAEEARTGERSESAGSAGSAYQLPALVAPETVAPVFKETKSAEERHQQRLSWFYAEASRQSANRREMAIDEGYYDSKQWQPEDRAVIEERGQTPVVYNEVAPTIDFLIGTERRSRVDFYVVAEDDDDPAMAGQPGYTSPSDDAINKTKLLKYLDDVNMAPFERSAAADDAFRAGLGILEIGLRGDKTGVPVFIGAESWRNFLHDSRAKRDQSDARYNFRIKEVDLDVAIAMFPGKEDALRAEAVAGDSVGSFRSLHGVTGVLAGLDTFGLTSDTDKRGTTAIDAFNARERVTLIECWSREPVRQQLDGGLGDPVTFKVRVAIMTETVTLIEAWSPFNHDRFPFVLVWGYRDAATGLPYSPTRRLRGPQDGLNRRMTRGIFEASFNQMELEAGAIDDEYMDLEELQAEANDPTGVLVFANGALSGQRVRQRTNPGAAREQVLLAESDRQTLRSISSVNEENRGLASQATSRVAMDAKAERGSVGTAELFDNLLLARQQEGELTLSVCEQFVKAPMTIRVAGEQGAGRFERTKINQPSHMELDPQTGEAKPVYINDITERRAHFVVGEQAWKQSYAESAFSSLMEVLTQLASAAPQVVVNLLDVVFDMHPNLPRKKTVIERIRAINGQADPDGKMTPEQQAKQQKDAQIAQAQFELQMAQLQAEVHKAKAQGDKLNTDAIVARVTALYEAAQAAQVLALAPGITPITDQLLSSAGFIDQAGSAQTIVPQRPPEMPTDPQAQIATGPQGRMAALMPPLQQADGVGGGSQTMRADGVRAGLLRTTP